MISLFFYHRNAGALHKNNHMTKQEIVSKIVEQEERYIAQLESTRNQYKSQSDLDEEATMDRQDMSHANEAKDMQLRLRVQLDKAKADLEELKAQAEQTCETVQAGAVVHTDSAIFYAGTSIHALQIENVDVLGVSTNSPAYQTMLGLKKGDKFTLGETTYRINYIS